MKNSVTYGTTEKESQHFLQDLKVRCSLERRDVAGGRCYYHCEKIAIVHREIDHIKEWFYPCWHRLRAGDPEAQAEFLRRQDTPGRVIIELIPQQWITYDGPLLESELRGIPYNPRLAKHSRILHNRPMDGKWSISNVCEFEQRITQLK